MISIPCPHCSSEIRVSENRIGQTVPCPWCKESVLIAKPTPPAPPRPPKHQSQPPVTPPPMPKEPVVPPPVPPAPSQFSYMTATNLVGFFLMCISGLITLVLSLTSSGRAWDTLAESIANAASHQKMINLFGIATLVGAILFISTPADRRR